MLFSGCVNELYVVTDARVTAARKCARALRRYLGYGTRVHNTQTQTRNVYNVYTHDTLRLCLWSSGLGESRDAGFVAYKPGSPIPLPVLLPPPPPPTLNVDTTPREQLIPGHARGAPFDRDQSLRSQPDKSLTDKPIKSGHVLEKVRFICVRDMRNFYAIILVIREYNREDEMTRFLQLLHSRNERRIMYMIFPWKRSVLNDEQNKILFYRFIHKRRLLWSEIIHRETYIVVVFIKPLIWQNHNSFQER